MNKKVSFILFSILTLSFIPSLNLKINASTSNTYFENFENIDSLTSLTTSQEASLITYNDSKVLSYNTNEKYGIVINKDTNLNSYYCLTLNYSHTFSNNNQYMYISITSDKYDYAGVTLKVNDDNIIECISGTNSTYDVKNYSVIKNGNWNIAKIFFWTGYEGDWHIKFGASSKEITCYVDNLNLSLKEENNDSYYYSNIDGVLFDNAENINEYDKSIVDGNYVNGYEIDGRITTDSTKVIEGTTSYYATSNSVLEWQPFIYTTPSKVSLKEKEIYTVSFDYLITGNHLLSCNIGEASGSNYRAFYLNNSSIQFVDAGVKDEEIGTQNATFNKYLDNGVYSSYISNKGKYNHAKLTFMNTSINSMVRFAFKPDSSITSDIVIDNITITKGIADYIPTNIESEEEETNISTKVAEFRFESENETINYQLDENTTISKENVIADDASLYSSSTKPWNDYLTYNGSIKPDTYYTIFFKYRFLTNTGGSLAYVNIKSKSNVDKASYLGFNENGGDNTFSNNVVFFANDSSSFYYNEAKIVLKSCASSDLQLVIGSKGAINLLIDDVVIYEGIGGTPVKDSIIKENHTLLYQEDFENGFGFFKENLSNSTSVIGEKDNVIDGKQSLYNNSKKSQIIASSNDIVLDNLTTYTMLFRVKLIENSSLTFYLKSNFEGIENYTMTIDSSYSLSLSKKFENIKIEKKCNYADIRIIFTTPEVGNSSLYFVNSNGSISLDDIIIYKGKADVNYPSVATPLGGGKLYLPSVKKNSSKVSITNNIIDETIFNEIIIKFDDYLTPILGKTINDSIKISHNGQIIEAEITFDYYKKTITISNLSNILVVGNKYTLTIEALEDSENQIIEKITKEFSYGKKEVNIDKNEPTINETNNGCKGGISYSILGLFIILIGTILFKNKIHIKNKGEKL